jgi:opacity protein-like surface antigen
VNKYILLALLVVAAHSADAQVRRRTATVGEPSMFVSLSTGVYGANEIGDGETGSTWDFGEGTNWQFRAAVEKALQSQFSLGAVLTYVDVPFVYIGPGCGRCDAHLDLTSIGASFHAGGGQGLHQVLEVSAGAAMYSNLKRDSDGTKLQPRDGNVDPFFTFGYGFGYTFNPTMQVSIVQDYGLVLHERTGLSNSESNTLTQRTTRLNFRMGFGSKGRRR